MIRRFTSGPNPSCRVFIYNSSRFLVSLARSPNFTPSYRARFELASAVANHIVDGDRRVCPWQPNFLDLPTKSFQFLDRRPHNLFHFRVYPLSKKLDRYANFEPFEIFFLEPPSDSSAPEHRPMSNPTDRVRRWRQGETRHPSHLL